MELDSPSGFPGYVIKESDGEVPVVDLWGIRITPLLLLLPGPSDPGRLYLVGSLLCFK